MSKLSFLKNMNVNNILIGVAIVGIIITGVVIYAGSNPAFSFTSFNLFGPSDSQIAQKAIDYVNKSGLSQTPASLSGNVTEESGLIKFKIKIGTSEFDSYVSKDGKLLFPQSISLEAKTDNSQTQNTTPKATAQNLQKTDKPVLEAYVVARCPYGLQMQRAMADAVQNVPSLAQYLKVRYMGSISNGAIVAMHGDAEAKENLRQICIRDEQAGKYWSYVACQMKTGDTAGCEKSTGVDSAKLNACTSTASRGLAYAKEDFDLSAKYNVQGSPTIILGDVQVDESGFGGRSSDGVKSIICAASTTQPSICSTKLNTAEAAVSFSATYAGAGGSGTANSGNNGANCAPAQ